MAIAEIEIEVLQNQNYNATYGFAMSDASGNLALSTPISFAGASAVMQVRETSDPNSTLYLQLATGTGLTLGSGTYLGGVIPIAIGTIAVAMTYVQTASIPPGTYYYDILVTNILGNHKDYYLSGPFEVVGTGSR